MGGRIAKRLVFLQRHGFGDCSDRMRCGERNQRVEPCLDSYAEDKQTSADNAKMFRDRAKIEGEKMTSIIHLRNSIAWQWENRAASAYSTVAIIETHFKRDGFFAICKSD